MCIKILATGVQIAKREIPVENTTICAVMDDRMDGSPFREAIIIGDDLYTYPVAISEIEDGKTYVFKEFESEEYDLAYLKRQPNGLLVATYLNPGFHPKAISEKDITYLHRVYKVSRYTEGYREEYIKRLFK